MSLDDFTAADQERSGCIKRTRSATGRMPKGFTLIELLVVVAIIGLLIAITLPSLAKARTQAKRTACASNLKQLCVAMIGYMQDSRDRMPYVSLMPSVGPAPLETDEPIYLADVLKRQIKGKSTILECPEDRPGMTDRPTPNTGKSYFDSERSSYEYRYRLRGLSPKEFYKAIGPPWHENTEPVPPNTVWIARDYDNFHCKRFKRPERQRFIDEDQQKIPVGARRYVYIDGHVSDFEN